MLKLAWRGVRYNTGRYIATLVAIMTGVSFFAASGFLGDRVVDSLEGDTRAQFGAVDLAVVRSETPDDLFSNEELRLPGTVADQIIAVDGVDGVALILTGQMALLDGSNEVVAEGATGRLWVSDVELNPLELTVGRGPETVGEIAIDRGIAKDQGLSVGDETVVLSIAGDASVTVVGITNYGDSDSIDPSGTISVSPQAAAAWLAGGNVEYQEVYLRGSASQQELFDRVSPLLPVGFQAELGDEFLQDKIDEIGQIGTFLKRGLQGFSVLAMLVGGFVIYNTFNVLVAQRLKELAVLRAIGATPKQVKRALQFEGIVVGLLGSALGVVAGVGFLYILDFILTRFGVELPGSGLVITTSAVVQPILLGTIVTVLSVMIPARRAARTEPIEALRDAAVEASPYARSRLIFTAGLALISTVLLAFGNNAWSIGAGLLGVFVATISAGPILAVVAAKITKPAMSKLGLVGRLASDNTARNPQRTAITANALLIGVFLVTLVSVAGTSVKDFVVQELQKIESADFFLASEGGSLDDTLVESLGAVDGVEVVEPFRREALVIDENPTLVSTANVETLLAITDIRTIDGSVDDLTPGSIAVGPDLVANIGDVVSVTDATGGSLSLRVVAVFEPGLDLEFVGNLVHEDDFDSLVGQTAPTVAFIDVETGFKSESVEAVEDHIKARPDLQLVDGNTIGKLVGSIFDFMINAVNGLLGMSVAVAVIGIINTLTLSIFERRRELGLLRVIGMLDKDVQRLVRMESILISLLGTAIGVVLGLFSGWVLLQSIQRLSDVDIPMNWAIGRVALILVLGVALGFFASLIPSARSTRLDVLDAIQAT